MSQGDTRDTSQPDILTVAQAAQILGVTARTIQRQCQAGKLAARRIETEFGEKWEIDRTAVEKAATEATTPARQGSNEGTTEAAIAPRHVAPMSQDEDKNPPNFAARYIAQIEDENRFLKLQIEEGNRNAAELRAALRKALEAQPRQLTESTVGAAAAPPVAARTPETLPAVVSPVESEKTPKIGSNRGARSHKEPRPLWKVMLGIR